MSKHRHYSVFTRTEFTTSYPVSNHNCGAGNDIITSGIHCTALCSPITADEWITTCNHDTCHKECDSQKNATAEQRTYSTYYPSHPSLRLESDSPAELRLSWSSIVNETTNAVLYAVIVKQSQDEWKVIKWTTNTSFDLCTVGSFRVSPVNRFGSMGLSDEKKIEGKASQIAYTLRVDSSDYTLKVDCSGSTLRVDCSGYTQRVDCSGYTQRVDSSDYTLRDDYSGYTLRDDYSGYTLRVDCTDYTLRDDYSGYTLRVNN
ncbi:hypothetical protein LSAT2_023010 [Lamellibrachia satsuma]|nr:hypothetical protein LSAT2_023010 [Lamellibrachia satsuma]